MPQDRLNVTAAASASVVRCGGMQEQMDVIGHFWVECFDKDGNLKWRDNFPNTVMTAGKNLMLDTVLAGSAYTVTGPYLSLISSVGYSAISAADTMASHAGWAEAGNGSNFPLWSTPASNARQTTAWSSATAGAKALSAASSFTIGATGGTIKGCILVFGTGAVATNNNTSGTLLSAGLFTGGDKVVATSDVVNVSYSLAM